MQARKSEDFLDNFDKLRGDHTQKGFVSKVFGIVFFQTVITVGFVYFCYTHDKL